MKKDTFSKAKARYVEVVTKESPDIQMLNNFGSTIGLTVSNMLGSLPVRGRRSGNFNRLENIAHMRITELTNKRGGKSGDHACMPGCLVQCATKFVDKEGK